jgi:amidohydrolase
VTTGAPRAVAQTAVDEFVRTHEHELIAFRRHLHAYPETSSNEVATTEAISERLRVAGLDPIVLKVGTGLICDVAGEGADGALPFVVLRADIDALETNDLKDVPYRSRNAGAAHACGHDAHSAIVLGAGLALKHAFAEAGISARVRLVFEPAEENVPGGAVDVINEGWLDGASAVFGVHCDPKIDVGTVGCHAGAITSASDLIEIELTGPGGHTARPHLTVDLASVAARVTLELPAFVQELGASMGTASVVFGSVHTGNAPNVIPATAKLRGTFRTPEFDVWEAAPSLVEQALETIVSPSGAGWSVKHRRGVPPVVNDEEATAVMAGVAAGIIGAENVVNTPQSMGGDSFAWYLQKVPGSYARLGVHDPTSERPRLDLHASTFDIDERAVAIGVRVLALTALAALDI